MFLFVQTAYAADPLAARIRTDTSEFDKNLGAADDNVQKALNTLDEIECDWFRPPIIEWYDPSTGLPADPDVGDRYGADGSGSGWTDGYIYEWTGEGGWVEEAPEEGWMLWDLLDYILWEFMSGDWHEAESNSYWIIDENQIDITGNKTGTFDFLTTGTGTFGSVVIPTVFTAMTEPSGFVDRTATLSFVDATRVFTITGNHDIYINGVKTSKTTTSITIDDATGINWVYYNASGVLSQATSIPSFALPLIATVYYNTVTDKGLLGEERHGIKMDGATHHLLHNTVGTRYESGLAGTFADSTFSIALGTIDDEDLEHTITPAKTTCNVLYKDGAADFKWLAGQTKYYYEDIGSDLNYNNGNVLTPLGANQYMAVWIFATNDTTTPIVSLIGQRTDANIADARANNKYESLTLGTLPFQEMKLLYRVILRNDATPYEEAQDLRNISNLPAGTYVATDHGVLTGLTDDDHPQYWVDSSVATRATNYATTGTLDFGGAVVEIPNGATVTDPAVAGQVAIDTTTGQFLYHDGTAQRILTYNNRKCFGWFDPADADDDVETWIFKDAATVTNVSCRISGGTSLAVVGGDGTNNFESITCDADGATDDGSITNATFTAGEVFELDCGAPSGTVPSFTYCIDFTTSPD